MDLKSLLHQIGTLYQNLSFRQRLVVISSIVVVVGFLVFLSIYKSMQSNGYSGYSVLFENVSSKDSALIIQQLEKDGVKYKLYNENTILVPTSQVYKERIEIASQGIPQDSKVGFEIFDKQDFGSTDEQERIKYQRALEGELSRTIESLSPIRSALVHIALPKDSVFTERQVPPSASVVITLEPSKHLDAKQINGIKNLVAASVPKLSIENVKLVNQNGDPLNSEDSAYDNEVVKGQIQYAKKL